MGKYIVAIAMFALGIAVGHAMKGQSGLVASARVEQVSPLDLMKNAKNLPAESTPDP